MGTTKGIVLLTCVVGLCLASAQAGQLSYSDFSSLSGLTIVGNTATASTSDGTVLRLTPAVDGQAGAAYSTTPFSLGANDTFSTTFQFRLTNPGGIGPADGITFVLAASPNGLGGAGGGLGYAGVPNSVAIEFDSWNNGWYDANSDNHVGIDIDGDLASYALTNVYGHSSCYFNTTPGCLSNGDLWTARITYDGASLSVSVQDGNATPFLAIDQYQIDIASKLGTSNAYVGFTAATGAGHENHDIKDWTVTDRSVAPPIPTPEPCSLALLGAGFVGIAGAIRRRVAGR